LAQARDQAREIVAAAQATADQVKAEAGGRGQLEYERIVASANAEVDTARQRAIDEASARIGEIVFELVQTIVGREVDQQSHEELIREAVSALDAEAQKGASL
jgi:F-type H+-transporting ATPase subunit b